MTEKTNFQFRYYIWNFHLGMRVLILSFVGFFVVLLFKSPFLLASVISLSPGFPPFLSLHPFLSSVLNIVYTRDMALSYSLHAKPLSLLVRSAPHPLPCHKQLHQPLYFNVFQMSISNLTPLTLLSPLEYLPKMSHSGFNEKIFNMALRILII